LDLNVVVDYLADVGFLRRRRRASLAARGPGRKKDFDRAWIYAALRDVPRVEPLPAEVEAEAQTLAQASWSISWMLAQCYSYRDASRVDEAARQFADLVSAESNSTELAKYYEDIESGAGRVLRYCSPETAAHLLAVLADRHDLDVKVDRDRKHSRSKPSEDVLRIQDNRS
jgi:hypothetical protein